MDHNDRQTIEGLFGKLSQASRAQPHRDPEAEALINGLIARNPGAAYYLAQTVIMQEQALNAAQEQMEHMQHQPQPQQGQGGGLFGRLFGGQPQAQRPLAHRAPSAAYGQTRQGYGQAPQGYGNAPQGGSPWNSGRPAGGGGGFMAGAAQTAMGVAGGVLLGNAIGGMFAGDAAASEAPAEEPMDDETGYDDAGFDDGGGEE